MKSLFKKSYICFILVTSLLGVSFADDDNSLYSYPQGKPLVFLGLDTESTAVTVQDGRSPDLQNVKLSQTFSLQKREGYSTVNATLDDLDLNSPSINGIFDALYSNGTRYQYAFVGSKVKYDSGTSWTTVGGSGTITNSQDAQNKCVMALDYAVCTNFTDAPLKISSTPTRSALSFTGLSNAVQKAKDVIFFRNYLIFVNTQENSVSYPTRFRWSNVGTIETWSNNDFNDIATFAGDEIVGISELYGDLYVFLTKSIWRITLIGGNDIFSYQKIVDNVGAIARDSIQTVVFNNNKLGLIFLSQDRRVYAFDGLSVTDIGRIIQGSLNGLSTVRLDQAVSTYDYESYYLSVTSSGGASNDVLLNYNVKIGEWFKYKDINANALARINDNGVIKTYFGNYDSFVYWMDDQDKLSDVVGASGIVDSVSTLNTSTITGAQVLYDLTLPSGIYTGATVKITSGTAAGEERVVSTMSGTTGLVVTQAFDTTPDTSSIYSVGAIDAYYKTKWFDLGDSTKMKIMRSVYLWADQESNNSVSVNYALDFGATVGSQSVSLEPSSSSLWDFGLWDEAIWGSTGSQFSRIDLKGEARYLQLDFQNDDIDSAFNIYGYNIQAVLGEID